MIPLSYALLGLLARAPRSGYDLLQLLEEPLGFFWSARRSQIYPELARLEAARLARHVVVPQRDRPAKKLYEPTEAGLADLRDWVEAPQKPAPERDIFLLQVYSLWLATPDRALELVRACERRHATRLERYEAIRERQRQEDDDPAVLRLDSPRFASWATLQRGLEYERGYLAWLRWLAEVIAAQSQPAAGARPSSHETLP
jgi:DNA-binding PadR family transcriptional regulator